MEVIIRGERGEGCTTLAKYLYHYLKILGYSLKIEAKITERDRIENETFFAKEIEDRRTVLLRTENYEGNQI